MASRVAVTGMGCVSGLGQGAGPTFDALMAGRSGVRTLERGIGGEGGYAFSGPAGFIETLDAARVEARYGPKALAHLDPFSAFATVATFEAIEQAGLLEDPATLAAAAVVYGTGSGGNATMEEGYHRLFDRKTGSVHPLSIPKYMVSAAASQLSIVFGVRGPAFTVASACASSSHAIVEGMHMVRAGRVPVAVVGGAEAPLTYGGWTAWKAVRAMSASSCRPFSRGRDGMILAEGAATLVLEDFDHARARGAPILGELVGAGASGDAFHITQPHGEGAQAALRAAHADAGLALDAPVLISSHGTGTEVNDRVEAQALRTVYGSALDRSLVIATKSSHGHLMGGGGAIELLLGMMALQRDLAPAVLNYLGPDPECDVPLALGGPARASFEHLVSSSFAFGGMNAVLIARRV